LRCKFAKVAAACIPVYTQNQNSSPKPFLQRVNENNSHFWQQLPSKKRVHFFKEKPLENPIPKMAIQSITRKTQPLVIHPKTQNPTIFFGRKYCRTYASLPP
jgi:hypothetical protein